MCLGDQTTGELVLSVPVPVVAMAQPRKFINFCKIQGVYLAEPTPTWATRHAPYKTEEPVKASLTDVAARVGMRVTGELLHAAVCSERFPVCDRFLLSSARPP